MANPTKRLADWQVSALMGVAAAGECPACWQMHGEWLAPARGKRSAYHRLCDALCRAGCTSHATPESVLRELERERLA